jgi:hypothetical protein
VSGRNRVRGTLHLLGDEAESDLHLASALPGLQDVLPHRVVEWERESFTAAVQRANQDHFEPQESAADHTHKTEWRLIKASLAFWESGGGLIALAYSVEARDGMDWS